MRSHFSQLIVIVALFCMGCGAPTKSPQDVAGMFADTGTLEDSVTGLCATLASRTVEPKIGGNFLNASDCNGAGANAQNYKVLKDFYFAGLTDGEQAKSDDIIKVKTRSQVWLNTSLVNLASKAAGLMQEKSGGTPGDIKLPESNGKLSGLAKVDVKFTDPFKFDKETFEFSGLLHLDVTGIVSASHDISINGKLIDKMIAVTIKTTSDQAIDISILKNFSVMAMIVPFAQDVYVDFFVEVNVHPIIAGDAFKNQVTQLLGSGLKSLIDSLMTLRN